LAEVVAFALSVLALAVVTGMAVAGLLRLFNPWQPHGR
jgi:hypothetical protein